MLILKRKTYFKNNRRNIICDEVLSRIQTVKDLGHSLLENTATGDDPMTKGLDNYYYFYYCCTGGTL
jgi:hypothetical protein